MAFRGFVARATAGLPPLAPLPDGAKWLWYYGAAGSTGGPAWLEQEVDSDEEEEDEEECEEEEEDEEEEEEEEKNEEDEKDEKENDGEE